MGYEQINQKEADKRQRAARKEGRYLVMGYSPATESYFVFLDTNQDVRQILIKGLIPMIEEGSPVVTELKEKIDEVTAGFFGERSHTIMEEASIIAHTPKKKEDKS